MSKPKFVSVLNAAGIQVIPRWSGFPAPIYTPGPLRAGLHGSWHSQVLVLTAPPPSTYLQAPKMKGQWKRHLVWLNGKGTFNTI